MSCNTKVHHNICITIAGNNDSTIIDLLEGYKQNILERRLTLNNVVGPSYKTTLSKKYQRGSLTARMCQKPNRGAENIEYLFGCLKTCTNGVCTWQVVMRFDEECL